MSEDLAAITVVIFALLIGIIIGTAVVGSDQPITSTTTTGTISYVTE